MSNTIAQLTEFAKNNSKLVACWVVSVYVSVFIIGIKQSLLYVAVFSSGILLSFGIALYFILMFRAPKPARQVQQKGYKFLQREMWNREKELLQVDPQELSKPIIEESFMISETLDEFISLIVTSFISSWFTRITDDTSFQDSISIELKHVFRTFKLRIENIDLAKLLVSKLVPIVNDHMVDYTRAVERVQTKINTKKGGVDHLDHDIDIARQYRRGKIHPAVTVTKTDVNDINEKKYLRSKIGAILPYLLSSNESNNDIGVSLVREILSCTVLANVFQLLGDSDFYNLMIVKLIGDNLKRRDQVKKLRAALDEHTKQKEQSKSLLDDPNKLNKDYIITENMDIVSYNNCLERIGRITSMNELKQLRVYISFQLLQSIQNTKIVPRLKEVQSLVENKIRELERTSGLTLEKALNNKSFVSVFSQFLNQLSKVNLLNFWLSVDKIKDSLKLVDDKLSLSLGFTKSDNIKEIYTEYLETGYIPISPKYLHIVEEYINTKDLISKNRLYQDVRDILIELQTKTYTALDSYFKEFTFTDEYAEISKVIKEQEKSKSQVSPVVIKAVEDAFTQIMRGNNDLTTTLNTRKQMLTMDLKKELFGDSTSLTDSNSSSRYSKIFDDYSDESGTDSDSINFDSDANSNMQSSMELDSEVGDDLQSLLLAAPGDLKLAEEIDKLSDEIDRLNEQQNILSPLIEKAEATNNTTELKILKNSKISLDREISTKELQKQQYIVQENDNSLYGKSRVTIQSYINGNENGKDYVLYIIEVQRFSNTDPNTNIAGWIIARRFSQFYKLHEYLRARYLPVGELKFPKRTMFKLQTKQVLEARKIDLEEYLENLLKIPEVCCDRVFRSFLSTENFSVRNNQANDSSKKSTVELVANTFYSGISKRFLTNKKTPKPTETSPIDEGTIQNLQDMEKELKSFEERELFIKPLINLLMTLFKLKNAKSWLRGRALLVILQQIFGTTIEKKIYEQLGQVQQEEKILDVLISLKNIVFPNGKFRESPPVRTQVERETTREESRILLSTFMTESFTTIFGVSNTKFAFTLIFNLLQNDFLMKHLIFEVFDELLAELFPEVPVV